MQVNEMTLEPPRKVKSRGSSARPPRGVSGLRWFHHGDSRYFLAHPLP
jgi:hypothetical protein